MSEIFAALMSICFIACNMPQFRQMVKTKSVEDINLNSCWIACLGNVFSILACLSLKECPVMFLVNNTIFMILSLIFLAFRIKYAK